jgi:uncharacterized membrane protein
MRYSPLLVVAEKPPPRTAVLPAPPTTTDRFAPARTLFRRIVPTLPLLPPRLERKTDRWGLLVVIVLAIAYTAVMFGYLYALHNTEGTHAEDLGIMDQVLWNSAHGHFWRQTICNPISDINCLGDTSRLAIHFEPSMMLLIPFYSFNAGPHFLQFVQVSGVALGVLPAYWLGSRRLQHVAGGVLLAVAYLGMPTLYSAVTDDFHMVTLAAPALLFALYFLYTRNQVGLIIACLIAMGTKEQVAMDVFMIGLACGLLQNRWRAAFVVMGMAVVWAVMALTIMHFASPLGASPTAVRYGGITSTLQRIPLLFTDPNRHRYYTRLFWNAGAVGILAPWMLVLALPAVLLNAISDVPAQYSAWHQYNTDIAPFLLVALLEGIVVIVNFLPTLRHWLTVLWKRHFQYAPMQSAALVALSVPLSLMISFNGASLTMNALNDVVADWPLATAHTRLLPQMLKLIPATASVAAQSEIVPHLSHRREIYQFPDGLTQHATYIALDAQSDYYPEPDLHQYHLAVQALLKTGQYQILYQNDGYLLLKLIPPKTTASP